LNENIARPDSSFFPQDDRFITTRSEVKIPTRKIGVWGTHGHVARRGG